MPGPLRHSLERMLPRLQAEEALLACSVVSVGGGSVKRRDARRWQRAMQRQAGGPEAQRAERPATMREHFANLAARGFVVEVDGKPFDPGGDA